MTTFTLQKMLNSPHRECLCQPSSSSFAVANRCSQTKIQRESRSPHGIFLTLTLSNFSYCGSDISHPAVGTTTLQVMTSNPQRMVGFTVNTFLPSLFTHQKPIIIPFTSKHRMPLQPASFPLTVTVHPCNLCITAPPKIWRTP
jgi:hypothetical protein